jgi:retinol dehydrogenase-12
MMPDLTGKVAIVSGASAGLGKITAMELAKKNAHVFCMGRNKEKTIAVVEEIVKESGNKKVEFIEADFNDLESVDKAASQFLKKKLPLHILVNNAGLSNKTFELSKQGIESVFCVNHFAHVVLTNRLLEVLKKSSPSRIVNISSMAHSSVSSKGINYDKVNDKETFNSFTRYAETKLANIHFTKGIQAKLDSKYPENKIYVLAVHPGIVASEFFRNEQTFTKTLINSVAIDSKYGAITQIFCAGAPDVEEKNWKGQYFVPYGALSTPSSNGTNGKMIDETMEWTQKVLKEKFKKDWKWSI